jgi:hypothetical protein
LLGAHRNCHSLSRKLKYSVTVTVALTGAHISWLPVPTSKKHD